ncbi:MAG: hypothetical protein R2747_13530 [Pyrinomonadaceae bacterium]
MNAFKDFGDIFGVSTKPTETQKKIIEILTGQIGQSIQAESTKRAFDLLRESQIGSINSALAKMFGAMPRHPFYEALEVVRENLSAVNEVRENQAREIMKSFCESAFSKTNIFEQINDSRFDMVRSFAETCLEQNRRLFAESMENFEPFGETDRSLRFLNGSIENPDSQPIFPIYETFELPEPEDLAQAKVDWVREEIVRRNAELSADKRLRCFIEFGAREILIEDDFKVAGENEIEFNGFDGQNFVTVTVHHSQVKLLFQIVDIKTDGQIH